MDPTGRDIIHLLDSSAAGGFGHSAALIGNDQDGWLYYSNDGPNSTTVKWFNNLDEFSAGKKELGFNYIQRKRNTTNQGQDKEMQDKAISFTKLSEGDVEMIKDAAKTHTDNSVTKRIKQQNKDDNIKKVQYIFICNNCSQNIGEIAEEGGLIAEHSLVPNAMEIMSPEEFKLRHIDNL